MSYPKISIITPSYNQGSYIEATIRSVLSQKYPNLEYIIIDGGSTDGTVDIIKKYDQEITYWVSEPDSGQSHAINKGLEKATGDIINWLNSDDYYEPYTLFKVAHAFQSNQNIKMLGGRSRIFNHAGTAYFSKGTDLYPDNLPKTIGWARIDQPETFFHASAVEKMGLLNIDLRYLMDRDWWIKYLFAFGLKNTLKINDVLVNFRLHETSKTVSQSQYFDEERNAYFSALASHFQLDEIEKIIRDTSVSDQTLAVTFPSWFDQELAEKSLHYYLLYRANECYIQQDKEKVKDILTRVQKKFLSEEDKKLWEKLYFRNKYIPKWLIKTLRST